MKRIDKTKTSILSILTMIGLVFAVTLSGTGLISALAAFVIASDATPFVSQKYQYTWTDDSSVEHNEEVYFDCYPISSGYSGSNPGIAVAWHNAEEATKYDTPAVLNIPATLKDESNVTYDVAAIYKGGFRYCDFSSISMPNAIQEIGEEAFAYCRNLTSFSLPFGCTEISPSMLMDCQALETFYFRTQAGANTTANSKVISVGDHAFLNCVKLRGFSCPTTLVYVGDSAFNNCKKLTTIFFPKTSATKLSEVQESEKIYLGNYAFAQCELLTMVYFDLNMWTVGQHVFNRCNKQKLNINYTGSTADFENINTMPNVDPDWRDRLTDTANTEQFNFIGGRGKFDYDHSDSYPGLYFTIDNDIRDLMLDQSTLQTASNSWQAKIFRVLGNNSLSGKTEKYIDRNDPPTDFKDASNNVVYKYATIIQFTPPSASDFDESVTDPYFKNGALKIPDVVTGEDGNTYPVRVIDSNVFTETPEDIAAGRERITSVSFSKYLMQIRHHSFLGCDNISSLDFNRCDDLLEISYEVFHKHPDGKASDYKTYQGPNSGLGSLQLPDCLKYIGAAAFYNFTHVSSFHLSQKTVFMGASAFENLGSALTDPGAVNLVLPNTLRDGPVDSNAPAYGFKIFRYTGSNLWDECIQAKVFKNAKCLKTVLMEAIPTDSNLWKQVANNPGKPNEGPKDHNSLKPYRMGFQINAFEGCSSMVRFEANKLLYVIGKEAFKGCTSLKEMFLTTFATKITNVTDSCAWGFSGNGIAATSEGSIFGTGSVFTDLIVYIDDPNGPPRGNGTQPNATKWNSVSATYKNEFSTSSVALVPFYNGVVRSDVKYYDLTSAEATTPYLDSTEFSDPCVAFIKKDGDYTITRCYCGSADITSEIDMSKFEGASNIKTIGSGSFGQMSGTGYYLPGRKIVLPSSVTTIGDRAFYRESSATNNVRGVQIVTYKEGGTKQTIDGKTNYCVLPSSVTSIGRLAFYNNCFESVLIKGNLSYLGNTAFGVFPYSTTSRAQISSIELGDPESTFSVSEDNGGLYYTKESAKKTLIYQPASFADGDDDTDDTELRMDSDTIAVGARSCANTKYVSVSFPNSATTVYGGAFITCLSLQSVTFGDNPSLKYIGAKAYTNGGDTEVWTGTNCDAASEMNDVSGSKTIGFEDYYGAFKDDKALTTFDFTKLNDSLVKIGYGAFENCTGLTNMVGEQKYSYYKWSNGALVKFNDTSLNKSNQILDLSGCSNLRAIGHKAFRSCTAIKFIHLPDNYDTGSGKALYLGSGEPESGRTSSDNDDSVFYGMSNCRVLVGEKSATANVVQSSANKSRYPLKTFDNNNIYSYFHAESTSDIYGAAESKYWYQLQTQDGVKRFVLFDNKAEATDFLGTASNLLL